MTPVNNFTGPRIKPAPKTQRFGTDEQLPRCLSTHNGLRMDYLLQIESSLTTRPAMAERTQSSRLPKTICAPNKPGE